VRQQREGQGGARCVGAGGAGVGGGGGELLAQQDEVAELQILVEALLVGVEVGIGVGVGVGLGLVRLKMVL